MVFLCTFCKRPSGLWLLTFKCQIMKQLLVLLALLFIASCGTDEKISDKDSSANGSSGNGTEIQFGYKTLSSSRIQMPYREGEFVYDDSNKPALLLYLHGGSSRGDDNEAPLKEAAVDSISHYLEKRRINAILVVPQCPSSVKAWGGMMNGVLKELIDSYIGKSSIDPARIYILGGSMGGTGTWSMVSGYPNLFAAAMPVAGNPTGMDADRLVSTPIYTVMGTSDQIMDSEVRASVAALVQSVVNAGGKAKMDTEEGWSHEMTCIQSYTTERLDWIFSHK